MKRKKEKGPKIEVKDLERSFISKVYSYPPLKPKEEEELSLLFLEKKDKEALKRLVQSHLRLVVKIALEYHRKSSASLMDLIQEGTMGLINAIRKYNPFKGVRLGVYAQWWIRAYILRYLLNNYSLIKIGTTQTQRKLFYNLMKEKELLEKEGYKPTPQLIAKSLDVTPEEVEEMEKRLEKPISLDTPVGEDENDTLMKFIPSGEESIEVSYTTEEEREMMKEKMEEFRKTLSGRDLVIWDKRIASEEPLTLREIGEMYGITRERVRQLEARLIKRFKNFLMEDRRFRFLSEESQSRGK